MRPALLFLLALAACSDRAERAELNEAQVKGELAQLKFQPGEWETRTEVRSVSAPGVPPDALAGAQRSQVTRSCVTAEQAANPDAGMLAGNRQGGCRTERLNMDGGRIDGRVRCNPEGLPGTAVAEVDGSYTRTAFRTDVKSRVDLTGLPDISIDVVVSSRRVGECSAGGNA